jgi:error-prone DNA polymerase
VHEERVREIGLDPDDPTIRRAIGLAGELIGFPRHLSQHVGGFVITRGPLSEVVPIENAAMEDRTVIEWDKDDLDALRILKIDVLGLGMLTCIAKAFRLLAQHYGRELDLARVPAEDPAVYDMLCRADSVGVFQVESRAQMTMLPRLRPRNFYDLVIEVAIVRPGPIQGDMVHPYLRRRAGKERVVFPSEALEEVLGKTLGVPLFQEQAMRIAIVAAGFTPAEADRLRRAMATFRRTGSIHEFRCKMIDGMVARGYEADFAERCFKQIEGFGDYGFPESHAASFALLVYVSAWLKCHYPAVFAAAILNSQPMGFYAPAQLVRDAAEHGVEVRPVDVNHSDWDCTLEPAEVAGGGEETVSGSNFTLGVIPAKAGIQQSSAALDSRFRGSDGEGELGPDPNFLGETALRLGLRQIKGMREEAAERLVAARGRGYGAVADLWHRAGLERGTLERLATADAFRSLGLDRRRALWAVKGLDEKPLPLFAHAEKTMSESHASSPSFRTARQRRSGIQESPVALDSRFCGNDDARNSGSGSSLLSREPEVDLPEMPLGQHVIEDYRALRLSLKAHPTAFLRKQLAAQGVIGNVALPDLAAGRLVSVAGLVLVRQRPGSAKGVIFVTLEDEAAVANVIVRPPIFERYRRVVLGAGLLLARGRIEREGIVIHILAETLQDLSPLLDSLSGLGPMEPPTAPADVVKHPMSDPRTALPKGRSFR